MADVASKKTDSEIKKLNKKLEEVYKEAQSDIQGKLDDFIERFKDKHKIYQEKLKKGEIKKEDYDAWLKGQIFQRKQWEGKLNDITNTLHNTNQIALAMVNGKMSGIFAYNANYEAYKLEHGAGINFGFGIYDQTTVSRLIKDDPQTLPKWKIEEPKEYIWNKKKVNNAITQGVIQGQKLDEITDSIASGLCSQNENLMKTFARTGMTEAQNAGRFSRLMEAKAKGITVVKQWMATLDGRTRDTHADIDGETQPVGDKWHPYKFSNGCRYPGDPQAPAREVYNCRCTLVGDVADYPAEYQRYDNIDGKPVKNMTYKEWYEAKYGKKFEPKPKKIAPPAPKKKPAPTIDYSKYGGEEVFKIMKKYDFDFDKLRDGSSFDEWSTITSTFDKGSSVREALALAKKDAAPIPKVTTPKKPAAIDYSKYGGEDEAKKIFDILEKYDFDYGKFVGESDIDEWDFVRSGFSKGTGGKLGVDGFKKAVKDAKVDAEAYKIIKPSEPVKPIPKVIAKAVEGATPRAASYIDNVTEKALKNYPSAKDKVDRSVKNVAFQMGITEAEAKQAIENGITRIIEESDFTMRIKAENLEKVLDDGYFKNQFETRSSGGAYSPTMRKNLENRMFNVPKDSSIDDADRPVYGMFCPKYDANNKRVKDYYSRGPGAWYGDGVTVVLKKDRLINNATMTLGDSLDYERHLVGTEVNNINYAGMFNKYQGDKSLRYIAEISDTTSIEEVQNTMMDFANGSDQYFEYQLHGKESHSADNIERVIIEKHTANRNIDLINKLKSMNIPYVIN